MFDQQLGRHTLINMLGSNWRYGTKREAQLTEQLLTVGAG